MKYMEWAKSQGDLTVFNLHGKVWYGMHKCQLEAMLYRSRPIHGWLALHLAPSTPKPPEQPLPSQAL